MKGEDLCSSFWIVTQVHFHLSEWTDVVRHQFIAYDLEANPIQIKTDSVIGSGDYLTVVAYTADNNDIDDYIDLGFLNIIFSNPISYIVRYCSYSKQSLTTPPVGQDKVWTIAKTSTNLIIICNEVKVLDIEFESSSPECAQKWSKYAAKIAFWDGGHSDDDTASDGYRTAATTCDALPDLANLEMKSGVLPVNLGTEVTVKCSEGFTLEGDEIITCLLGNHFIDTDSPSCLKSKENTLSFQFQFK